MEKIYESIVDIEFGPIFIPKGTILYESQWCYLIGRKGGIELEYSSDKKWWKEKN